jgi:hypothetical protein
MPDETQLARQNVLGPMLISRLECGWLAMESRPLPQTTRFPKQTIPRVYSMSMRQVLTELYDALSSRLCWHWLPRSDNTSVTFSLDQVLLPNAE